MNSDITAGHPGDAGGPHDMMTAALASDVPAQLDTLPDGQPSVMYGDVKQYADFNHKQGDNLYGFNEDCGLVSCQDVLNQFGVPVSETDVVTHAITNNECNMDVNSAFNSGGTTPGDQAQILNDFGVPAHAETGQSAEDLASNLEHGHGAIVEVNAGVLWHDPNYYENGQSNHAITVTGVARDPATGQIQGFYINDSGDGKSAEFVPESVMTKAWIDTGGQCVITDAVHTADSSA
jgi:hypothetical protein